MIVGVPAPKKTHLRWGPSRIWGSCAAHGCSMSRSADDYDDEADLASGTFVRPWSSLSSSRHCCCHRTVVVVSAPIDPHLDKRTNIDEDGQRFPHDFSAISSRFYQEFWSQFSSPFYGSFPHDLGWMSQRFSCKISPLCFPALLVMSVIDDDARRRRRQVDRYDELKKMGMEAKAEFQKIKTKSL